MPCPRRSALSTLSTLDTARTCLSAVRVRQKYRSFLRHRMQQPQLLHGAAGAADGCVWPGLGALGPNI